MSLTPIRDPERNRLREIYADRNTFELHKVVATDKLFIEPGNKIYPVIFTITLQPLDGIPVVTHIHGIVGGGYDGDGQQVDYDFKDIQFPTTLPEWYFDPHRLRRAPERRAEQVRRTVIIQTRRSSVSVS